jgi:hypothetical protein
MIETRGGLYNHPQRTILLRDRILEMWVQNADGTRRVPRQVKSIRWDQREGWEQIPDEVLYLARVETTGGGGAVITRREMFLPPVNARYGASVQGEDVPLCEQIRKCGHTVALYSGIRGLHLTRALFEEHGVQSLCPYGEWVEDWKTRNEQRETTCV